MKNYLHVINDQIKKIITNINAKYKALIYTHHRKNMFEVVIQDMPGIAFKSVFEKKNQFLFYYYFYLKKMVLLDHFHVFMSK